MWKVLVADGQAVALGRVGLDFTSAGGAAWFDDGRIVFTTGGVWAPRAAGARHEARPLLEIDPAQEADFHNVVRLPGDRGLIFLSHLLPGAGTGWRIELFTPRDGKRTLLFTARGAIFRPSYSTSGHLPFGQGSGVWALPFSLSSLNCREPFTVTAAR